MEQYIPKTVLLAEIEALLDDEFQCNSYDEAAGFQKALTLVEKFIDTLEVKEIGFDLGDPKGDKSAKHIVDTKTLEVKEVDLKKEISFQWSKFCISDKDKDSFVKVAKHFFELGMSVNNKAQEGE